MADNPIPQPKIPGNLDPYHRKILNNPDGSYSTTSSASRGGEQGEILYPTVVDGVRLKTDKDPAKDEAWQHYLKTGEHFGIFDTPENADKYAIDLHNKQEQYIEQQKLQELAGPKPQGQ